MDVVTRNTLSVLRDSECEHILCSKIKTGENRGISIYFTVFVCEYYNL